MNRLRDELSSVAPLATDETLERVAEAVHKAAHWLPPWSDPITLVVASGFEAVAHGPGRVIRGRRRVGFEWDADDQVRGLRILLSFSAALLREVLDIRAPDRETVGALAARLLIPTAMMAAARRDPCQPMLYAPKAFVLARIGSIKPTSSGTYAVLNEKR